MNDGQRPTALQIVTQAVGLFAGLATIVYLAGGIALALRLVFQDLPWESVIGQLPREFLLATGAGQVMLPAFLAGALYAFFRLLRWERAKPPAPIRWRDGWKSRPHVLARYLLTLGVVLSPAVAAWYLRDARDTLDLDRGPVIALVVLLVLSAIGLQELRAMLGQRYAHQWNSPRPAAIIAGVYTFALVPAFMAAAAVSPLVEAKVCTTDDFEEDGFLVGQAGDRVYLGEPPQGRFHRRLAVFPLSRINELFIGEVASAADCDFGDARLALVADERASSAAGAAADLKDLADQAADPTGEDLMDVARDAVSATRRAGLAVLETADAAKTARAEGDQEAWVAGNEALDELERLEETVRSLQGERTSVARRKLLADAIGEAARSAQAAATVARSTASGVRDAALRRQPSPG